MAKTSKDYFVIAKLGRAHGIKGEFKVQILSEDEEILSKVGKVHFLSKDGSRELASFSVDQVRGNPQKIIKFKEISDRTLAETYAGSSLALTRAELDALREDEANEETEDEHYIQDFLGLECYTEDRGHIGTLADISDGGGNLLFVIERPGMEDLFLPARREFVREVDLDRGRVDLILPDGLWELYD